MKPAHCIAECRAARVVCLLALLAAACQSAPADPGDTVVARVGDHVVTASDLELDYELGLPVLKRGEDPVGSYLQGMINERLLAQEGYRLGLDQSPEVRSQVADLEEELLVGEVFEREVHDAVRVSAAEIDSLRISDQISIKLRFVPASRLAVAERLRDTFRLQGHSAAVAELASSEEEFRDLRSSEMETAYMTLHDLDPAIRAAVDELPVGEVSEPIAYRGGFLVVQLADIRRAAVAASASPEELERYTQVAFQAKAKRASRAYIKQTVAGVDLRLKAAPYRTLERGLWEVVSVEETPSGSLMSMVTQSPSRGAAQVKAVLSEVLMETSSETWTVGRFLTEYPQARYPLSRKSYQAFRSDLYDAFGLLLRDRAFLALARERGYDSLPTLQDELRRWESKWVYRALVDSVRETISVSTEDCKAYFERHQSFWPEATTYQDVEEEVRERAIHARLRVELDGLVQRLAADTRIEIDDDALSALHLDKRSAPLSLFRGSTGRPAWPVLDYGL